MVRVGVEYHIGVRIEFVLEANLPQVCPIEIGLGNAVDDENGDQADELNEHQPCCALARCLWPFPVDGAICSLRPLLLEALLEGHLVVFIAVMLCSPASYSVVSRSSSASSSQVEFTKSRPFGSIQGGTKRRAAWTRPGAEEQPV